MNLRKTSLILLAAAALAVVIVPATQAALVAKMDLGEMTFNADRIARVTVLDVEQGSMTLGGGELPVVTYTLRVDEAFKGQFDDSKGVAVIEVRMVGNIKQAPATSGPQHFSALPEMPHLTVGHDYLLFATAPSAVGLSAPVGLGQGTFRIYTDDKDEMAANELDNAGLFSGPVSYTDLADAIRNELGQ
jgi:hypothetical protein